MIDISRAETIDGWMTSEELVCLAELATRSISIVEIGSWKGRSTVSLATHTLGTVCAEGSNEPAHIDELHNHDKNWLLNEFKQNISGLDNIEIVQMDSLTAAKFLKDMKFDLIFIDASHDYEPV